MKELFDRFNESRVQSFVYDCLKATHERTLAMGLSEPGSSIQDFPWRTGDKQMNIIGVRGFVAGEARSRNLQNQWDDTIFVAWIENGEKKVAKFSASLDYSDGSAPILLEGCYRFSLGLHNVRYFFKYPGADDDDLQWGPETGYTESQSGPGYKRIDGIEIPPEESENYPEILKPNPYPKPGNESEQITSSYRKYTDGELAAWNKVNRIFNLNAGYEGKKAYRALVGGVICYARDANQNLVYDPGELGVSGDPGINIHYGGEDEKVGSFGAGCQVIKGWTEFIGFMALMESDLSIIGSRQNELTASTKPPVNGTQSVIYTLVQGSSFAHFLETQTCAPIGAPRENGFGKIHAFEFLSLGEWRNSESPQGTFPVGASMKIHPGFHIVASGSGTDKVLSPVLAKVVCARLADDKVREFGSTNFILLEFNLGRLAKPVYALLMHLGKQDFSANAMVSVPWIKRMKSGADGKQKVDCLTAGGIVRPDVLVMPGEVLGIPGKIGATNAIHFEVFSEEYVFLPEMHSITQKKGSKVEVVYLPDFPKFKPLMISKVSPGDTYALPGEKTVFQVKSITNLAELSDRSRISWRVRIISEEGVVLHEDEYKNVGPILEYEVPQVTGYALKKSDHQAMGPEILWSDLIAQPYIDKPDCRWVIYRKIVPSPIVSFSADVLSVASNPLKLKDVVLAAFKDVLSEAEKGLLRNAQTTKEVKDQFVALILKSKSAQVINRWDSLVLKSSTEWNFYGSVAKNEAESNGYRWNDDQIAPYMWWGDASGAGVALPSASSAYYYNPILFLRAIALPASSFVWISNKPIDPTEIDYKGDSRVKDASDGDNDRGRLLKRGGNVDPGYIPFDNRYMNMP